MATPPPTDDKQLSGCQIAAIIAAAVVLIGLGLCVVLLAGI